MNNFSSMTEVPEGSPVQGEFRPLRRAGVSRRARRDRGFAPGPHDFLKKIE